MIDKNEYQDIEFVGSLTMILQIAGKTTATMISRLNDVPDKSLTRRFKYAVDQLKTENGNLVHNFNHNIGIVSDTFKEKVLSKNDQIECSWLNATNDETDFNANHPNRQFPIINFKKKEEIIENEHLNDCIYTAVFSRDKPFSPCPLHNGLDLKRECLICRDVWEDDINIKKSFLERLNVSDQLLEFLFKQHSNKGNGGNGGGGGGGGGSGGQPGNRPPNQRTQIVAPKHNNTRNAK